MKRSLDRDLFYDIYFMKLLIPYNIKDMKVEFSKFTDNRDNKEYDTVIIDGIEWFRNNLDHDNTKDYGGSNFLDLFNIDPPSKKIPHRDSGRLYSFDSASSACPEGWELPARSVWIDLFKKITKKNPHEWKQADSNMIYQVLSGKGSILNLDLTGYYGSNIIFRDDHKDFIELGEAGYFWSSNPGALSNGGLSFVFSKKERRYKEIVSYEFCAIRPIRKNI